MNVHTEENVRGRHRGQPHRRGRLRQGRPGRLRRRARPKLRFRRPLHPGDPARHLGRPEPRLRRPCRDPHPRPDRGDAGQGRHAPPPAPGVPGRDGGPRPPRLLPPQHRAEPRRPGAPRRQHPRGDAAGAPQPARSLAEPRPRPVGERHPGGHGRAEERLHRPDGAGRDAPVPRGPLPRGPDPRLQVRRARALRRRRRGRVHDDEAGGKGHALPALQPRPRRAGPATPTTRRATAPPICGRRSGPATAGSTSCTAFSSSTATRSGTTRASCA